MDLTIDTLSVRRGGRMVLRDVSFGLQAGQAAALRGPNGVGKSTLLRAIAGLVPVVSGILRLEGREMAADPQAVQERIAYAGHLDAVKAPLSVRDNLTYWCGVYGRAETAAEAVLARFGLAEIAGLQVAECSAGQKRRLGLARLSVIDRPLWLLDEPTVSLDREAVAVLTAMIRDYLAGGGMAVIATHVDLGLDGLKEWQLTRPEPLRQTQGDPFLEGAW
ncbi:MAG: heme ABC exporter ATP-binding protein CcmA [Pseudomonadota bacterium]